MFDYSKFHKNQQLAISHRNGPALVLAGPGSGKTLVITHRIYHLIHHHQINPSQILVITFTKAAAIEMKQRFLYLCNGELLPVTFGTFHSVFFHMLSNTYHYNNNHIMLEQEKRNLLTETLLTENIHINVDYHVVEILLKEISKYKNSRFTQCGFICPTFLQFEEFLNIYNAYIKKTEEKQKIDFDDMIIKCYELLQNSPEILKKWQEKFQYILVDEVQDMNYLQYEIIKKLAKPKNNLFIVGDDDQSIYGFRGANSSIMIQFPQYYQNCKIILLNQNYRSEGNIVKTSTTFIKHNKHRYEKKIDYNRGDNESVIKVQCSSKEAQGKNIIELCLNHKNQQSQITQRNHDTLAIICRTNTGVSWMAEQLAHHRIPFMIKEKITNIYDHFIVRDLLAYLKLANGSKSRAHFFEIMNKPTRYFSRGCASNEKIDDKELYTYYEQKPYMKKNIDQFFSDLKRLQQMIPYAAIQYIRKGIGYEEYLKKYATEKRLSYQELLETLDRIHTISKGFLTLDQWEEQMIVYGKILNQPSKKVDDKEGILIITMHFSKGLEFDQVIIPDIIEGIIPHKRAVTTEEIEEERRMLYVAMTRAKQKLYLFTIKDKENDRVIPSRFYKEINIK